MVGRSQDELRVMLRQRLQALSLFKSRQLFKDDRPLASLAKARLDLLPQVREKLRVRLDHVVYRVVCAVDRNFGVVILEVGQDKLLTFGILGESSPVNFLSDPSQ